MPNPSDTGPGADTTNRKDTTNPDPDPGDPPPDDEVVPGDEAPDLDALDAARNKGYAHGWNHGWRAALKELCRLVEADKDTMEGAGKTEQAAGASMAIGEAKSLLRRPPDPDLPDDPQDLADDPDALEGITVHVCGGVPVDCTFESPDPEDVDHPSESAYCANCGGHVGFHNPATWEGSDDA